MLVVMKRAFIHSFHLLLVCLSVSSETNTEFKTNCHIHDTTDNNNHSLSPESVFLQEATSLWLYPSQDEIMKYYEKGYKSCNEFLKQHTFNIDIAPIYTDPNGIDFNGQLKCRGMDTLYSVTGLIMYPFGPIDSCSTYSKCWHGILSCGTFNADNVMSVSQKAIEHILHKKHPNGKIPTLKEFSMKSMQIFTRLVGPEIVVPEQRYLTLSNSASVIIGQYTLTRPPNPPTTTVTLEMRLQEFIPGILIDWTANQKQEHGLYSTGTVYLGGSEGRCRAWTNCNTPYYCCGCDEKSFLPTAPISVNVIDGYNRCPNLVSTANGLNSFKQPALPLCTLLKQAGIIDHPPGRWLLSTEPSHEGEVCSKDNKSNVFRQHKDINDATPQEIDIHTRSPVTRINSTWSTASGDPCIINSHKGEEGGHRHYFYAPYACKYHFFTGSEARHCLAQSNRTHIHFQGDSMSRDLFSAVASYLGVSALSEKEVKKLTNEKHERHIQLGSNETILTESYYWHFSADAMSLLAHDSSLFPDIVITNNAMAHRNDFIQSYQEVLGQLEEPFWSNYLGNKSAGLRATLHRRPSKELLVIYQSARELHGRRNHGLDCAYSGNIFRECSTIMRNRYSKWQDLARQNNLPIRFKELDEYQITQGRLESYRNDADGWHFHLESTQRQMEIVILFNIICSNYLLENYD